MLFIIQMKTKPLCKNYSISHTHRLALTIINNCYKLFNNNNISLKALMENITNNRQGIEENGKISWGTSWQAPIPKIIACCIWIMRLIADCHNESRRPAETPRTEDLTPFLRVDWGNVPEASLGELKIDILPSKPCLCSRCKLAPSFSSFSIWESF